jgi:hypothetical protein
MLGVASRLNGFHGVPALPREAAIARDEALDHRYDQAARIGHGPAGLAPVDFGIGHYVAMDRSG